MTNPSVSANDGFTLIEVLISLSIMAIVLVAVFKLHTQSISMSAAAKFHATATLLAQTKLSEIQSIPLEELHSDSGNFGETFAGYKWFSTVEDVESETLDTVSTQLKKIRIVVSYGEDQYRHDMTTYHFFQDAWTN